MSAPRAHFLKKSHTLFVTVFRDAAIVLRTHKLGEADRIITLLTREQGLRRAVARGVRKSASRFGARLEPFSLVDVQLHVGRSLDSVREVQALRLYGAHLAGDYEAYQAASAACETALQLTESDAQLRQFQLLNGFLRALTSRVAAPSQLLASYFLRALGASGWEAQLSACVVCDSAVNLCAFSVSFGGVVCADCLDTDGAQTQGLNADEQAQLVALHAGNWDAVNSAPAAVQSSIAQLVAHYAQWHLDRRLRSLQH